MNAFDKVKEIVTKLANQSAEAAREFDAVAEQYKLSGWSTISREVAPPAESLHEAAKRYGKVTGFPEDNGLICTIARIDQADAIIDGLRKWAAENPPKAVKTYREDFFEKFPDAKRRESGYPLDGIWCFYKAKYVNRFDGMTFEAAWDKPLGYWES